MAETITSIAEKLGLEDPTSYIKEHGRKRKWRYYGLTTKRVCEALAEAHNKGSDVIFVNSKTLANSQRIADIFKRYLAKLSWTRVRVVVVQYANAQYPEHLRGLDNYVNFWDHY